MVSLAGACDSFAGEKERKTLEALLYTPMVQGPDGETVLTGPVIDQAALHGILNRICDLGVPLLSVRRVEQDGLARLASWLCSGSDQHDGQQCGQHADPLPAGEPLLQDEPGQQHSRHRVEGREHGGHVEPSHLGG